MKERREEWGFISKGVESKFIRKVILRMKYDTSTLIGEKEIHRRF